jgi:hypothetical protein
MANSMEIPNLCARFDSRVWYFHALRPVIYESLVFSCCSAGYIREFGILMLFAMLYTRVWYFNAVRPVIYESLVF